jgi:sortase A
MEPDPASVSAPDPHPLPWRRALGRAEKGLYLVAVLALGWCGFVLLDSARYEQAQEARLEEILVERASLPRPAGRTPGPAAAPAARVEATTSGLVGRLELPRIGLTAIVAEGTGSRTLRRAVGHVRGSALPGENGNVVLAAHRDRHFRPLKEVREGDLVWLTTPDGRFEYRVEFATVVEPDDAELVQDAPDPVLTLVTCYPFYYVGDAPQRFLVRARLVTPVPAS